MDRAGRGKLSIVVISSVFPWKIHLKIIACVMFGVSSSHQVTALRLSDLHVQNVAFRLGDH